MSQISKYLYIVIICLFSCKKKNPIIKQSQAFTKQTKTTKGLYKDLNGNIINLDDYIGKMILVNFWSTSCKPCINEIPSLERSKSLLEKEGYVFLLASNETIHAIKAFKAENNFKIDFLQYTGSLSQIKVNVLPTTFIYNEKGTKVSEIIGAKDWSSIEMITKLKAYRNK